MQTDALFSGADYLANATKGSAPDALAQWQTSAPPASAMTNLSCCIPANHQVRTGRAVSEKRNGALRNPVDKRSVRRLLTT